MGTVFKLPLLGETLQGGTILKWHKREGEPVEGWETLLEVETDKVNMEVDPQVSGVLRKILAPEGTTVPVGGPVAIIGTADEPIDALLAEAGSGRIDTETRNGGREAAGPVPGGEGAEGGNGATGRPDRDIASHPAVRSAGHPVIKSSAGGRF